MRNLVIGIGTKDYENLYRISEKQNLKVLNVEGTQKESAYESAIYD